MILGIPIATECDGSAIGATDGQPRLGDRIDVPADPVELIALIPALGLVSANRRSPLITDVPDLLQRPLVHSGYGPGELPDVG